jgi:hypothetical protein
VAKALMNEAGDGGVLEVDMVGVGCMGRLTVTTLS